MADLGQFQFPKDQLKREARAKWEESKSFQFPKDQLKLNELGVDGPVRPFQFPKDQLKRGAAVAARS